MTTNIERPARLRRGVVCLDPFDRDGRFVAPSGTEEVRRRAILGVGASTFFQVFGVVSQIAWTVVLARLLVPADFGLVTMVTTFSLLLLNAGLNGLTEAIVQCDQIDHRTASNLFWVSAATGVVCSIAFAGAGPLIALFFRDARVPPVAAALSLSILLTSTVVVHRALLMRAMRFGQVYAIAAAARTVSIVVAIALAWTGWGYWALVAGAIAQPLGESVGAWGLCRWTPGPPRTVAQTGAMLRFALHVYGRFSFNYFARNVDNVLVGWRFDAVVLGYYKKAFDLFAVSAIFPTFSAVAVSALSRFRQDAARYRRYVLKTISMAALLGVGLGGVLTVAGRDVIRLLLGAGWDPAGDIFVFFAPGIAATFVYGVHGWVHVSSGTPDKWLRWGGVEFVVVTTSFFVGLRWGAVGVAAASSASWCLLVLPALWYAGRRSELRLGEIAGALWRYVVAGIAAGACTHALAGRVLPPVAGPDWLTVAARMTTTSATFVCLYAVSVVTIHRSVAPLRQVVTLVLEVLPRRSRVSEGAPAALPGGPARLGGEAITDGVPRC